MEIKLWEGGLQEQEVVAIEKIKNTFKNKEASKGKLQGGSLREQLSGLKNPMYPWKGYAGFRFVQDKYEGEFDLLIVTHCNVLIVELKDWNFGEITFSGDKWFKNNKDMGRSPVSVTRNKKFNLDNKLKRLRHKFSNKGFTPRVDFFVVMTGNAGYSKLPENELKHVISLEQFLEFADERKFGNEFRPHSKAKVLNKDFAVFDQLIIGNQTAPKQISVNGYKAEEEIFKHPKGVYKEFVGSSEVSSQDQALIRMWDFNKLEGTAASTPEGRFKMVSREREVLQFIKHNDHQLYLQCLRSLTTIEKEQVTTKFNEVYELPSSHQRLNQFIGKYLKDFSEQDRLNIIKLLVAKFADLHEIEIAHRDLGDHSLWISPAKEVALSSFISAYHKPQGTVGDYRDKLSVTSQDMESELSPYRQDVVSLIQICWHIFIGERVSEDSLSNFETSLKEDEHWISSILYQALVGTEAPNACKLFELIKQQEPKSEEVKIFDSSQFERFTHSISHYKQYREDDDYFVENDEKEVYLSNGNLVKAWLNVSPNNEQQLFSFELLNFFKKLDKLSSLSPDYIPKIFEYGLAKKSSSLYLVTEFINGKTWSENHLESVKPDLSELLRLRRDNNPFQSKLVNLAKELARCVEHLHGLGLSHGDLHPDNVIVVEEAKEFKVYLIDFPDFSFGEKDNKNHQYSPDHLDNVSASVRDNFAVIKMIAELLNIKFGEKSDKLPEVAAAINLELEDLNGGFTSLSRFKSAFDKPSGSEDLVEVYIKGIDDVIDIFPDNGKLYVYFEKSKQSDTDLFIHFSGIGGVFKAIYSSSEKSFFHGLRPIVRDSIRIQDIDNSTLTIDFPIRLKPSERNQFRALNTKLTTLDAFNRAIETKLQEIKEANKPKLVSEIQDKEVFSEVTDVSSPKVKANIATRELWKAIIKTETESHPYIELVSEPVTDKNNSDQIRLMYSSDTDILGGFNSTDIVEAIQISKDKEVKLGEVVLKHCSLNEVRLSKLSFRARNLNSGELLYFRSKQDKASFRKRKAALQRLLDKEGTISNLVDLFDPKCESNANNYNIEVTPTDFERYDRTDDHGTEISLNQRQRDAFQKLVSSGPLSLLQGPPGTGKTEFIAAFVHYLIEKQDAQKILLVSQSHEAVNTAAERIRKHCNRLETPIDVVRFSNREKAVSDGLKDAYSNSIITEKREMFKAEAKYRIAAMSSELGVQKQYLELLVEAELKLFSKIDQYLLLQLDLESQKLEKEEKSELKKYLYELETTIKDVLDNKFDISIESDGFSSVKGLVVSSLNERFSINPSESKRALALTKLARDKLRVLETDRVNYDEFLARSRHLVTGTCVGIGQNHIGIHENQYDWVIIDEAARSISSELAIAMQSGKRVLLVGDHQQLPPLYSDAHKKALAQELGIPGNKEHFDEVLRSDFARAFESSYGSQTGARLLTQYRMAPPIGNIVSDVFYNSELENGDRNIPEIYHLAPKCISKTVTWLDTSNLGKGAYHNSDRGVSIYNRSEADAIIKLLKEISQESDFVEALSKSVKADEAPIGVICMYGEQKRILRRKFGEESWTDTFKSLVKIDTVDSYQGKENRIILLSITRSDRDQSTGFLRTPNRINVALSRAMDRLIVVGDKRMWSGRNAKLPLGEVLSKIEADNKDSQVFDVKALQGVRR